MDWILIVFFSFLVISLVLIVMTLISLPKLGDERKRFIKMKAQSYTFTIVIGYVLIEIARNIYKTTLGDGFYAGMNPFSFLVVISATYLISLRFSKKKYGG